MDMEYSMQWDLICRICLHEGEMRSIFDTDDEKNMTICDKIVKCSNITLKHGMNLPEQICNTCLDDLNTAYRFRTNCENSDAILQSFLDGNLTDLIISSNNGEVYKYKPPAGLNVKRIKTSTETTTTINTDNDNEQQTYEIQLETINPDDLDNENNVMIENSFVTEDYIEEENINDDNEDNKNPLKLQEQTTECKDKDNFEEVENTEVFTIKPVKSNRGRARGKNSTSTRIKKEKVKILPAQDVTVKADGTAVIRIRKSEEEKPLKICEICGNTYKYKHALESHMRRHRNEKPFACEICGRAFVINFELRRHMRTHTGQKPYVCRYCGRRFSDFGSRIKHERTHTGERPYVCETCGKAFSYSHVLQSHILTHTGEKRYECTVCGKRFTKSHHLKAHMNTHTKNQNKSVIIKQTIAQTIPVTVVTASSSTSPSSSVTTSTWAADNSILRNALLKNEQKIFIEATGEDKIYFHTANDKVFLIKQEKEEKEENLDFSQCC